MTERSMNGSESVAGSFRLQPLPYHVALRDYLKSEESQVWNWFSSDPSSKQQAEAVRLEILKSTYRLDAEENAELYSSATSAAQQLGLDVPTTIYQAQNLQVGAQFENPEMAPALNASIAYLPDEIHIILHGDIRARLAADELRALLGHELSHFVLWRDWDGDLYIVHRILTAMCTDANAHSAHFASARLLSLYNEIFCDRGAYCVVDNPETVASMLVKVQTNVNEVSGASYIRQAQEIFDRGVTRTSEITHPEAFIRARALQLWADNDPEVESKIQQMIEGSQALEELDLLAQRRASELTRRVIDSFLAPQPLQTVETLAHARAFFADYTPPATGHEDVSLAQDMQPNDASMRDYYCYLLLDFVSADRELEELPMAGALAVSERLGLKARFTELARKELRLRKKQIEKIDNEKESLLAKTQ